MIRDYIVIFHIKFSPCNINYLYNIYVLCVTQSYKYINVINMLLQ